MSRCSKCKQDKPKSEFNLSLTVKAGVQGYCRQCSHSYLKAYEAANKERIRQRKAAWYQARKAAVVE